MKRGTPLRRTPMPKATKPMKRATKPIPAKRAKPRRTTIHRDPAYREWCKDRRCVACSKLGYGNCGDVVHAHGPSAGTKQVPG